MDLVGLGGVGASRQMEKCEECRRKNVKQRCNPVGRVWPEKCERCLSKGLACGPSVRCRKRSRGDAVPPVSDPTAPATPSNLISTNAQLTPPSSGSHRLHPFLTAVHEETVNSTAIRQSSLSTVPSACVEDGRRAAVPTHTDVSRNRRSRSCNSHVYLGHLRNLYEIFCSCLRSTNPNAFLLRHGLEVNGCLVSKAGNIVQDYRRCLWEFINQDSNEESVRVKARLLEALRGIASMNEIADKEMFRDQKVHIYERLISIYKEECNLPEALSYMIPLEQLLRTQRTPHDGAATIADQIADSLKRTSQELVSVSDEVSRNLESPLLDSPWLHRTQTPFPPLHRALRARLDKSSEILAKEKNGLDDRDFLNRKAVQVAVECGNTRILEECLEHNGKAKDHADILNHTPVFVAAAHGNLEALQSLVRRDPSLITVKDRDGATLMDVAAAGGHTELAKYLLDLGFDITQAPMAAASPLHTAAERGHTEFCELLLKAGLNADLLRVGPNGYLCTAAMVAYHKSCEASDAKVKEKFFALALQIARAEEPPQYSLKWIECLHGEAEGSMASHVPNTSRSLGPSPIPPGGTLRPTGSSLFGSSASVNRNVAGETFSSIHSSNNSALSPITNPQLTGRNDSGCLSPTYLDPQYSFMSWSEPND